MTSSSMSVSNKTATLPYIQIVVPLYIAWRVMWANRLPILDCDEVYNYWEPLHYLLYGNGFQTWEYGHEFGLRTYAYLLPLALWARICQAVIAVMPTTLLSTLLLPPAWRSAIQQQQQQYHSLQGTPEEHITMIMSDVSFQKLLLFCMLRASLAACSAVAELAWCRVLQQPKLFPTSKTTVAPVTLWLLLTSAGMAHASSALLPSSTLMILWMCGAICYLQQQPRAYCVIAILATLGVGWPFGVVLFVPKGLDVLYQTWQQDRHSLQPVSAMSQLVRFIIVTTLVVQGVVMSVDYYFYGRWISPIWNILQYNARGGGDTLYGVEPLSYYVKNIVLNFNYMGLIAMLVLPAWWWLSSSRVASTTASTTATSSSSSSQLQQQQQQQQQQWRVVMVGMIVPLYLWLWLVVPRPHKEERFLYPIYPLICFGAALTMDVLLDGLAIRFFRLAQAPTFAKWAVQSAIWLPSTLLSALRILALTKYYQAPMILFATLHAHINNQRISSSSSSFDTTSPITVCTCGEWYRYPSSFFLPDNVTMGFLPSSFRGQLPQTFTPHGSRQESPNQFNDINMEQRESYVNNSANCQYLIALESEQDCGGNMGVGAIHLTKENKNKNDEGHTPWTRVVEWPLLSAQQTTSTLHRAFYVPFWHPRAVQHGHVYYDSYILYERRKKEP